MARTCYLSRTKEENNNNKNDSKYLNACYESKSNSETINERGYINTDKGRKKFEKQKKGWE